MLLRLLIGAASMAFLSIGWAQNTGLAATIGVMVFPSEGQDATQQSIDEATCYNWAVDHSGSDPFQLAQQAQQQQAASEQAMAQAEQAGQGAAGRGAGAGAATGALVGAVFGDSSKTTRRAAATGALIGGGVGRSQRNQAQAEATAQVEAQAANQQQATEAQMTTFKNAFGACLEGLGYIARS